MRIADMPTMADKAKEVARLLHVNGRDEDVDVITLPMGWGDFESEFLSITVRGDWKHDHARMNYLMTCMGFALYNEAVTESDGSDFYTSEHVYFEI